MRLEGRTGVDPKIVKELRRKMAKEAQIADVWTFFLDHFVDASDFMELGGQMQDLEHPVLAVIAQTGKAILARNGISTKMQSGVRMEDCVLVSVPEHQMIHGQAIFEGYLCAMLYLEDIQMGILYIYLGQNKNEYARFTLTKAEPRRKN